MDHSSISSNLSTVWCQLLRAVFSEPGQSKYIVQQEKSSYIANDSKELRLKPKEILDITKSCLEEYDIAMLSSVQKSLGSLRDRVSVAFYNTTLGKILHWFEWGEFKFFHWTAFYWQWEAVNDEIDKKRGEPPHLPKESYRLAKMYLNNRQMLDSGREYTLVELESVMLQHWASLNFGTENKEKGPTLLQCKNDLDALFHPLFDYHFARRAFDELSKWKTSEIAGHHIDFFPQNVRSFIRQAAGAVLEKRWWSVEKNHYQITLPRLFYLWFASFIKQLKAPIQLLFPEGMLLDALQKYFETFKDFHTISLLSFKSITKGGEVEVLASWLADRKQKPIVDVTGFSDDMQKELFARFRSMKEVPPIQGILKNSLFSSIGKSEDTEGKDKALYYSLYSLNPQSQTSFWEKLPLFSTDFTGQASLVEHILAIPDSLRGDFVEVCASIMRKKFFTGTDSAWQAIKWEDSIQKEVQKQKVGRSPEVTREINKFWKDVFHKLYKEKFDSGVLMTVSFTQGNAQIVPSKELASFLHQTKRAVQLKMDPGILNDYALQQRLGEYLKARYTVVLHASSVDEVISFSKFAQNQMNGPKSEKGKWVCKVSSAIKQDLGKTVLKNIQIEVADV